MEIFDVILLGKEAKTAPAPIRKRGKKKRFWPLLGGALFILAALAIIFDQPRVIIERDEPAPPELPAYNSIAVLPFDNLSDDRENAYFTRGVHEDILTSLSKVKALKVISRTSVMQYENNKNTQFTGNWPSSWGGNHTGRQCAAFRLAVCGSAPS